MSDESRAQVLAERITTELEKGRSVEALIQDFVSSLPVVKAVEKNGVVGLEAKNGAYYYISAHALLGIRVTASQE